MAGASDLKAALQTAQLGEDVDVQEAPCIGRCHQAPAVCVGQHEMGHASVSQVQSALAAGHTQPQTVPGPVAGSVTTPPAPDVLPRCISGGVLSVSYTNRRS